MVRCGSTPSGKGTTYLFLLLILSGDNTPFTIKIDVPWDCINFMHTNYLYALNGTSWFITTIVLFYFDTLWISQLLVFIHVHSFLHCGFHFPVDWKCGLSRYTHYSRFIDPGTHLIVGESPWSLHMYSLSKSHWFCWVWYCLTGHLCFYWRHIFLYILSYSFSMLCRQPYTLYFFTNTL